MNTNLVWFRNDLRIYDNTALYRACESDGDTVIALFIFSSQHWIKNSFSIKKMSFMHCHVHALQKKLLDLNIYLHYYKTNTFLDSIKYFIDFCKKYKVNKVFYNYQYEIHERNRDCLVKKKLAQNGIIVQGFHDNLLVSTTHVYNGKNQAYKKFTAFKNKIIPILYSEIPQCYPAPKKRILNNNTFFPLLYNKKNSLKFDKKIFPIGEKEAINKLKEFCAKKIKNYSINRNFPFLNNTSMLSPYLSIGVLSSRTCLQNCIIHKKYNIEMLFTESWINEIIWREFYYHLLIGYPCLNQSMSLQKWEKYIIWINNPCHFSAWKKGKTGFPIIDAGMRQLKKIGWMHNRLRMITASFLVKNLCIDWRKGEKYFMSHLIDGDFALNNGGWQWAASIGSDSVPYIRTFNPLRQSKVYDASGFFIRKFIPELINVPNKYIHEPHIWATKNNFILDYPKPIINYSDTRKKFLSIFYQARSIF